VRVTRGGRDNPGAGVVQTVVADVVQTFVADVVQTFVVEGTRKSVHAHRSIPGDSRVNQVGRYLGGGFTLTAPFTGRPQDEVGLAMAAAVTGSHYQRARGAPGGPATAETTPELTYLAQFGSWFALQPDVQYVIHPGKTPGTRNALVSGLRITVSP
jgi:carbohydrate-selective porin OprB